jgi:hypothetical protein
MAEDMSDDALSPQMNILRSHLQKKSADAAAKENLAFLESVVYSRQGTVHKEVLPTPRLRQPGWGH